MDADRQRPLVLSASPRPGGNSDAAAGLFAAALEKSGHEAAEREESGPAARLVHLRDHHVLACVACDACGRLAKKLAGQGFGKGGDALDRLRAGPDNSPAFGCPLTAKDNSADLLFFLASAPLVCFVSPIYFYHLPAHFKALLDRLQSFWSFAAQGLPLFAPAAPRSCRVILTGARKKGEKLFAGSLLSLKYALAPLNLRLTDAVTLYGLDQPGALAGSPGAKEKVEACARAASDELAEMRRA